MKLRRRLGRCRAEHNAKTFFHPAEMRAVQIIVLLSLSRVSSNSWFTRGTRSAGLGSDASASASPAAASPSASSTLASRADAEAAARAADDSADGSHASVFSCPLRHAAWDAPTRVADAIAATTPFVAACRVTGAGAPDADSDSASRRERCARAEADLAALLRARAAQRGRAAAFVTRRGAGTVTEPLVSAHDAWGGSGFSTWFLNHSVRGAPAVLDSFAFLADATPGSSAAALPQPVALPSTLAAALAVSCAAAPPISADEEKDVGTSSATSALSQLPGCSLSSAPEGLGADAAAAIGWLTSRLRVPAPVAADVIARAALRTGMEEGTGLDAHASAAVAAAAAKKWSASWPRVLVGHSASRPRAAPAGLHVLLVPLDVAVNVRMWDAGATCAAGSGGGSGGDSPGEAALLYPRLDGTFPRTLDAFELDHTLEKAGVLASDVFSAVIVHSGDAERDPHVHLVLNADAPLAARSALAARANAISHSRPNSTAVCPLAFPTLVLSDRWEVRVAPGQALFVPSGLAFAWHADGSSSSTTAVTDTPAVVVEWAFADASNVATVRAALESSPAVHSDADVAGLLTALEMPDLDVSVARKPVAAYAAWETRGAPGSRPLSAREGERIEEEVDDRLPGETDAQARRRRRKAAEARSTVSETDASSRASVPPPSAIGSQGRLREWQEERRWETLLSSLTAPVPGSPTAISRGRTNVTLMWRAPHSHAAQRSAAYRVSWHGEGVATTADTTAADAAVAAFRGHANSAARATSRRDAFLATIRRLDQAGLLSNASTTTADDGTPIVVASEGAGSSPAAPPPDLIFAAAGSLDFTAAVMQAQAQAKARVSGGRRAAGEKGSDEQRVLAPGTLAALTATTDHSDLLARGDVAQELLSPSPSSSPAASELQDECTSRVGDSVVNRTWLLSALRGLSPAAAARLRAYERKLDEEVEETAARLNRATRLLSWSTATAGGNPVADASITRSVRDLRALAHRRASFLRPLPHAALVYLGGVDSLSSPPPPREHAPRATAALDAPSAAARKLASNAPEGALARHAAMGLFFGTAAPSVDDDADAEGSLPQPPPSHSAVRRRVLFNVSRAATPLTRITTEHRSRGVTSAALPLLSGATGGARDALFHTATPGCGAVSGDDIVCLTVGGLAPGHAYAFRVAAVDSNGATSVDSGASPIVETAPLSPPGEFAVPPTGEALDSTSVMLSWPPLADAVPDTGGLPLLGLLVTRQDIVLAGVADASAPVGTDMPFTHHVVVPAAHPPLAGARVARALREAPPPGGDEWAPARGARLIGLLPNSTYAFRVAAITALGVGKSSPPSSPITLPPLTLGRSGRVVAVVGSHGRLATAPAAEFARWSAGGAAFDTSGSLSREDDADALAALAQLHAAVAVASHSLRVDSEETGSDCVPVAELLERSGLGGGAWGALPPAAPDARDVLDAHAARNAAGVGASTPGRAARVTTAASGVGLGAAIGLWTGTRSVAYPATAGETLETELSPLSANSPSLLAGVGGPALYSDIRAARAAAVRQETRTGTVGARGAGRLLVPARDPYDAAAAATAAESTDAPIDGDGTPRTAAATDGSPASTAADEDWALDGAYMAMALGRVAPWVRTLAKLYDASALASAARAGLDCDGAVCFAPGARASFEARDAARILLSEESVDAGSTNGVASAARAHNHASPCVSPLVTLADATHSLTVDGVGPHGAPWSVTGWASAWAPRAYEVRAEAVAAVPLRGNCTRATRCNDAAWAGRVVVFERGPPVSLADKVAAAAAAGALGAIIVDDESARCGTPLAPAFSQQCVQGSDRGAGGGFAAADEARAWKNARLPALLITRGDGEKLLSLILKE